jgi:hypothetical protein
MARFAGRRRGPLLPLAMTILAMGTQKPRREPRGPQALGKVEVRHCTEHDVDVHGLDEEFHCHPEGHEPHYLCPECGSDIGDSAGGDCSNPKCELSG